MIEMMIAMMMLVAVKRIMMIDDAASQVCSRVFMFYLILKPDNLS